MSTTNTNAVRAHIRWQIRRDMPEVLAFDQASAEQAWQTYGLFTAWAEDDYLAVLQQRDCIGMVAEVGEKVVGVMVYRLHAKRLELLHLVVDPLWRGRAVGSQLIDKLVSKLSGHRRQRLTVDADERNLALCKFLSRCGLTGKPSKVDGHIRFTLTAPEDATNDAD
jgi:ribosomal-protein-alanine N-acetyltransferase